MVAANVSVPAPAFVRPPGLAPLVIAAGPLAVAKRLMPNDVVSGTLLMIVPTGTPAPLTVMPTRSPAVPLETFTT